MVPLVPSAGLLLDKVPFPLDFLFLFILEYGAPGPVRLEEEEEEKEELFVFRGYCRGTQGARCQTDGASLQPDESEGCSPVSAVGPTLPSLGPC